MTFVSNYLVTFGGIFYKSVSAKLAFTGTAARAATKPLVGTLTFTGTTARRAAVVLYGAVLSPIHAFETGLGALTSLALQTGSSLGAGVGVLTAAVGYSARGTLNFAGSVRRALSVPLAGALLTSSGNVNRAATKALTGALTFLGAGRSGILLKGALVFTDRKSVV